MLFAVVFGVGLSELGNVKGPYDLIVLALSYIAVLLSWWGYNWGTIRGPQETNVLNYFIDCLLLVVYWLLINDRSSITSILLCYSIMFLLYWLWEAVRAYKPNMAESDKKKVVKARYANFLFFLCMLTLLASRNLKQFENIIYIGFIAFLVITYRIWIHMVYREITKSVRKVPTDIEKMENDLVALAKCIAAKARVPLSGYRVGAAILASSGKKYMGCNIEFENYSNTIHAEEAAISSFIGAGEKDALMIAVFTFGQEVVFPCGMCRQSLYELSGPNLKVIACTETIREMKTMGELLPNGFHL